MKREYLSWIYAAITVLTWSTAFAASKIIVDHVNPMYLSEMRVLMGGLIILVFFLIKRDAWPKGKDWLWFALCGILGHIGYQIFFTKGLETIPTSTSSILVSLAPLITAVLASKIYRESLSLTRWLYIISAFVGVAILLLWDGVFSLHIGALWTIGCATMISFYNIITRYLATKGYSALAIAGVTMTLGGMEGLPLLLPAIDAYHQAGAYESLAWNATIYLAIVPTAIAFVTWAKALETAEKTSDVLVFLFITPMLATILGMTLLGEWPNLGFYIGGAIILGAVFMFNSSK